MIGFGRGCMGGSVMRDWCVSVREAAELLGVCTRTVERRIDAGRIEPLPHTPHCKYLIPISELWKAG